MSVVFKGGCQLRKQPIDWYGEFSANTNMELVNRNDIEIEGNDVEMNWQGDYLQAMCWF